MLPLSYQMHELRNLNVLENLRAKWSLIDPGPLMFFTRHCQRWSLSSAAGFTINSTCS